MENNTQKTKIKQQRYHKQEKCIEKDRRYNEENKEKLQKKLLINTKDQLKEKNIRKGNRKEIDPVICLKKTDKS